MTTKPTRPMLDRSQIDWYLWLRRRGDKPAAALEFSRHAKGFFSPMSAANLELMEIRGGEISISNGEVRLTRWVNGTFVLKHDTKQQAR